MRAEVTTYFTENAAEIEAQYDGLLREPTWAFISRAIREGDFDPSSVSAIDLGAGFGHYAELLATSFRSVIAVEPVSALRTRGQNKFPNSKISWEGFSLPELSKGFRAASRNSFSFALACGVFHYLDERERSDSLDVLAEIVPQGGRAAIIYPYPVSRPHQFEVTARATTELINKHPGWALVNFEELPYPVPDNTEALARGCKEMAFDLERV